jgi:hypothetical protein
MHSDTRILQIASDKKVVNYKKSKNPLTPSMKNLTVSRNFESQDIITKSNICNGFNDKNNVNFYLNSSSMSKKTRFQSTNDVEEKISVHTQNQHS